MDKYGQASGSTLRHPKTEVHCPCGVVFKSMVYGHGSGRTGLGGAIRGMCPACRAEVHVDTLQEKLRCAVERAKEIRLKYPRPAAEPFTL